MRSDKISLNRSTRFAVRRYFWYVLSRSDHGGVKEKKLFSCSLACNQVTPFFRSVEEGCLTQYQLFSKGSLSFKTNDIHLDSSPAAIRSGFVNTPSIVGGQLQTAVLEAKMLLPIVRCPSGSCNLANVWAPWFSKSARCLIVSIYSTFAHAWMVWQTFTGHR